MTPLSSCTSLNTFPLEHLLHYINFVFTGVSKLLGQARSVVFGPVSDVERGPVSPWLHVDRTCAPVQVCVSRRPLGGGV